jgi:molybdate transport system substrate-binding protein
MKLGFIASAEKAFPVAGSVQPSAVLVFAVLLLALTDCKRDPKPAVADGPVVVAAAADLMLAFEELGRSFEKQTGSQVTFTFGSTGLLAKQLKEGGPFDVFAAANVSFVDQVVATGACDGTTKAAYARGRIAVVTRKGAAVPPKSIAELTEPRFAHVAIANPEHAPYGQAAREALQSAGAWSAVEPRLILGENVRQTLQYVATGNVEVAIVALSLVVNDHDNPWFLVDEALHKPIDQALAVCNHGRNRQGGAAFARFINSEPGRAVMRRYGFLLPGEQLTQTP